MDNLPIDWTEDNVFYLMYQKSLLARSADRTSDNQIMEPMLEHYIAITINPCPHKQVVRQVPGQRSKKKLYKNFEEWEQKEIVDRYLSDLLTFSKIEGDVCYERTQLGHVHLHTTIRIQDEDYARLKIFGAETNAKLGPKTYKAFDDKILVDDKGLKQWFEYIHKNVIYEYI